MSTSQPPTSVEILQSSLTDIGSVLADLSPEEIDAAIHRLTTGGKYALLKHHRKPSVSYAFPTTYMGGCNCSFLPSWLKEYSWMDYSECLDGASCVPCVLFCKN